MYGSATEASEHESPALQAGGPPSRPSGLNEPRAKYVKTNVGEWWGGLCPIGWQVSHPLFQGGPRSFLQTTHRLSSLTTV